MVTLLYWITWILTPLIECSQFLFWISISIGEYNRGVIDYRKEQENNKVKMEPQSPKRNRSRSRSPLRRSRSPRDDRRDRDRRDRRSGVIRNKGTKGKEFRCYVTNLCFNVKWMNLKDLMKKSKLPLFALIYLKRNQNSLHYIIYIKL